jgi:hypothetical protein
MATEKYSLSGIKKVFIGPASNTANLVDMFEIDNFNPGSFVRTKNVDTIERIIADGKSAAYITFSAPGDPDRITFALLDQNPKVEQLLSNVIYDAATSTITELAKRKVANIALQIFTELKNGKSAIITIPNIDATLGTTDPLTFNNVEKFVITGDLKGFITVNGEEAISIKQWLDSTGQPLNASPATVSAGNNSTTTTATKALNGTASPANGKTIASQYWTLVSGPNTPAMSAQSSLSNTVSGLVSGTYVFRLTVIDSAGVETSSNTQVTVNLA